MSQIYSEGEKRTTLPDKAEFLHGQKPNLVISNLCRKCNLREAVRTNGSCQFCLDFEAASRLVRGERESRERNLRNAVVIALFALGIFLVILSVFHTDRRIDVKKMTGIARRS